MCVHCQLKAWSTMKKESYIIPSTQIIILLYILVSKISRLSAWCPEQNIGVLHFCFTYTLYLCTVTSLPSPYLLSSHTTYLTLPLSHIHHHLSLSLLHTHLTPLTHFKPSPLSHNQPTFPLSHIPTSPTPHIPHPSPTLPLLSLPIYTLTQHPSLFHTTMFFTISLLSLLHSFYTLSSSDITANSV